MEKVEIKSGSATATVAILCICFGAAAFLVPVIGWLVGGFLILLGIFSLVKSAGEGVTGKKEIWLRGPCPYCGNIRAAMDKENTVSKCKYCRKRFVVHGGVFEKIE